MYRLAQDNDAHWYVIPVDKTEEFNAWCALDDEDENGWVAPYYTIPVCGSYSLVEFSQFKIK
jgi:hypothetical protein